MSDLVSEPLAGHHDRASFRCGVAELDSYLHVQATQDVRRKVAAAYVMVNRADPQVIAGYCTLSSFAVETAGLPEEHPEFKTPNHPPGSPLAGSAASPPAAWIS